MKEEINDEGFEDVITIRNLEKQLAEANMILKKCWDYFEWSDNASKEDCTKQDDLSLVIDKHLNL